jgi:hypothetical protein
VGAQTFSTALAEGTRVALTTLAEDLAERLTRFEGEPAQRLSLVRSFLAVLRDLESLDRARAREARLTTKQLGAADESPVAPSLVDELRARRSRRYGA